MKKIMKKALSLALALVMMFSLAPMTAWADETPVGAYENPYELTVEATRFSVYLPAGETAYVKAATTPAIVTVGYATGDYMLQYGRQTIYPNQDADRTASFEMMAGYDMFSVYNPGEEAINVYMALAGADSEIPAGTWDNPEKLEFAQNWGSLCAQGSVELAEGNQGYYYTLTAPADGAINVYATAYNPETYDSVSYVFSVNNDTKGIYGDYLFGEYYGEVVDKVIVSEGDVLTVFITTDNGTWTAPAGAVTLFADFCELGSEGYPAPVEEGDVTTNVPASGQLYYEFVATQAGKVTVTIDEACTDWFYTINNMTSYVYGDYHYSSDSQPQYSDSAIVAAGDVVMIVMSTDSWGAGTINWTFDFEAGEFDDEAGDEGGSGNEGGSDDEGDVVEKEPYYQDEQTVLELGEQWIILDTSYEVTLFEFNPVSTGTYTFTLAEEDEIIGYYGSNIWFPYDDGSEKTNTVTVNYPEVGGPIVIGVSNTVMTVLTIERTGDAQEVEKTPETIYSVSAPAYVFTGDVSDLTYVDIEDKTEDKAVYSVADGYYHLNTVDGPILLVNLMDEVLALGKATGTGKVAIGVYDAEGKLIGIENWNNALDAYVASMDSENGLYPLTAELMHIYKLYGEQQGWYTETGFVGGQIKLGNAADAWMFACMYVPNAEDGTVVVPPVVVAPEDVENKVVDKDTLTDYIEEAVEANKPVVVPTTSESVTITFEPAALANAVVVDLNIEVVVSEDVKDETVAKNEAITEDNFVLKVEFSHEGALPAEAVITIAVPVELAGETLYYYEILADGTLRFVCEAPVDANGNAKVTQDHCSDYVLLTEKIVEETPEAPKTGDATNFALWIAVLGLGVVAMAGSVVMKKREF